MLTKMQNIPKNTAETNTVYKYWKKLTQTILGDMTKAVQTNILCKKSNE